MGAAGPGCSAAHAEPTSELCLARSCERRPLFVPDSDPLDFAVADSISDRIKRVANKAEYLPDANFFENVDQSTGHCL